MTKTTSEPSRLKGWQQIAAFLGQPVSVAQRWAKLGMPVAHEGGRVAASSEELNQWLSKESAGEPVQIATSTADLTAELKHGLSFVRKRSGRSSTKKEEVGDVVGN